VWLLAMFDLPVKTRAERRRYARWRKHLLREGFSKMQFSVYAQHFDSQEASRAVCGRLLGQLPPAGEVRFLSVTERQIEKMIVHVGRKRQRPERPRDQLAFF
jgi:CRISPR-associated protein Cas2